MNRHTHTLASNRGVRHNRRDVRRWATWVVAAALTVGVGCRDDSAPVTPLNVNLGSTAKPLLPTPLPKHDASLLTGRADLIPPAALDELGSPDDPQAVDRRAIKQIIETLRSAIESRQYDDLIAVSVPQQRPVLTASADKLREIEEATDQLLAAIETTDPLPPSAKELASLLNDSRRISFTADDVVFDSEKTASVTQGSLVFRFHKSDEGWLIESPNVAPTAEIQEMLLGPALQMIQNLTTAVEDTSSPIEPREAQLAAMLHVMKSQTSQPPDGS
jgi:hypothetical protein